MDVVADWNNDELEKQRSEIRELLKTPLSAENTWYLIDVRWFKQWKKFVGFGEWESCMVGERADNPGPIDNSMLFKVDFTEDTKRQLKDNLSDEIDYNLVPKAAWDKLRDWYGVQNDEGILERHVIEQGVFVKHSKVEVYLMELNLCLFTDLTKVVTREFSHADTVAHLHQVIREAFSIPTNRDMHLWSCGAPNVFEALTRLNPDDLLQDAGLYMHQTIVVELRNEDGSWPQPRSTKMMSSSTNNAYMSRSIGHPATSSNASNMSSIGSNSIPTSLSNANSFKLSNSYGIDGSRSSIAPGLCGLGNLGNTCFMNSAIQCMSNVPALTNYMVNDRWRAELNVDNPLGMHGDIATQYAELIKVMWSGKINCTMPRYFKSAVGRFKPEFSGYQQQDSQELMAFLLDGLHEDLNRIRQKPYIEMKEADGRQDKEVAREVWSDYIRRNDSIIVDIFHGLLKSTLVCPECHKVSVKFDPFCYLSLPLPVKKERQIEVFVVPWEPMKKLRQCKVTVLKMGIISHLCIALSQITKIPAEKMLVVDVYNHRFHRIFTPSDPLTHILERDDIFVYELPMDIMNDKHMKLIPVYMRLDRSRLFGVPTVIAVQSDGCTYGTLYNCILNRIERVIRRSEFSRRFQHLGGGGGSHNDDCDHQSLDDDTTNEDDDGSLPSTGDKNETKSSESASSEEIDENGGGGDEDISDDCDNPGVTAGSSGNNAGDARNVSRLFSLSFVNIYGSAEITRLQDDSKMIHFTSQHVFLAADWSTKSVERFYDEKAAEDLDVDESVSVKPLQKKQQIHLADCLELFTTKELLGEHDLWFCPVCKRHEQATKKFDIWQLPRVLVIHLKRFSYTRYWRDKIDTVVDFPIRGLNMNRWVINPDHEPAVYDLIAISNHYGGMGGGHYTAYAKNIDKNWYHFDDSTVAAISEDNIVTKAAYVLVYERRRVEHRSSVDRPPRFSGPVTAAATGDSQQLDSDDDPDDESSSVMMETN